MTYFKTDTFAAPGIGLLASALIFGLGMLYLNKQATRAKKLTKVMGRVRMNRQKFHQKHRLFC